MIEIDNIKDFKQIIKKDDKSIIIKKKKMTKQIMKRISSHVKVYRIWDKFIFSSNFQKKSVLNNIINKFKKKYQFWVFKSDSINK